MSYTFWVLRDTNSECVTQTVKMCKSSWICTNRFFADFSSHSVDSTLPTKDQLKVDYLHISGSDLLGQGTSQGPERLHRREAPAGGRLGGSSCEDNTTLYGQVLTSLGLGQPARPPTGLKAPPTRTRFFDLGKSISKYIWSLVGPDFRKLHSP